MDCCLVSMPYMPVERPSLALGILQSILRSNGISVVTSYANIQWCEQIGILRYGFAEKAEKMFGEWTFAQAAFPEFNPDGLAYFSDLFGDTTCQSIGIRQSELSAVLADWRKAASDFIDEIASRIVDEAPRVVGASSSFVAHVSSLALLKRIRHLDPRIITLLGGANCESVMGLTTHEKFPWVDYVVSGEGDDIVVDLMQGILDEGRNLGLDRLPAGVIAPIHRESGYSGLRDDPPRAVSMSFKSNPPPDYDDYFSTLKAAPILAEIVRPGLPVEGSRGCWWGERRHCTFCSLNGASRKYRAKPPTRIVDEIDALHKHYGVNLFGFADNIANMNWFQSLFPMLGKRTQRLRISCEITPVVGREHLRLMKKAGIDYLQPGIESLDTEVLALLNKATQSWQNVRFLKWCSYFGIYVPWWLLDDVPAADNGWYTRTAHLCPSLCHLQPPRRLHRIVLSRFSNYHRHAERYKLSLEAHDSYSMIYPLSKEELNNLAYCLQDRAREQRWADHNGESETPPERKSLVDAVVQWNELFDSATRPVLEAHDVGSEIHIHDTRPCAKQQEFVLPGNESNVYRACEDGIEEERLYRRFEERGMPAAEIEGIIKRLLHDKILLSLDKHLLSLGLPQPCTELPPRQDFPCGAVDNALYMAINRVRENPFAWWRSKET